MRRVYLPSNLTDLARAQHDGRLEPGEAHAVTPAVREWYVEGDQEELEYSAMIDAAEASLGLLAQDPEAPRRRVVLAADVPDGEVEQVNSGARSTVRITGPVPLSKVVSIHIDEEGAEKTVQQAVEAYHQAKAGDDDARFLLDEAEALDLLWYDVTEIDDLIK